MCLFNQLKFCGNIRENENRVVGKGDGIICFDFHKTFDKTLRKTRLSVCLTQGNGSKVQTWIKKQIKVGNKELEQMANLQHEKLLIVGCSRDCHKEQGCSICLLTILKKRSELQTSHILLTGHFVVLSRVKTK